MYMQLLCNIAVLKNFAYPAGKHYQSSVLGLGVFLRNLQNM